uniref:Uncharacterized protein n=1 Tax=Strix occidentalis caurina TaxID=311401 RepID=A0A8D0KVT0_STROC
TSLFPPTTGQCLHVLMGHVAAVRCVQYDGHKVVSGAYDYTVKVWDPESESCTHTLQGHTNRVYSLQVRPGSPFPPLVCAVGSRNGTEETKLLVLDFDVDLK